MSKQKCILTKGLQGSGKSHFTKDFINKNQNWKCVNRDSIRHMTNDYIFKPKNEKLVQQIWKVSVKEILESGYNIIIDEMNLNPKTLEKNIAYIKSIIPDIHIEVRDFDISLDEAIERDKRRSFSVGEKVIRSTYKKYIEEFPERDCYSNLYDLPLTPAFIFDIDGTVALKHPDRDIYDGSKVYMDLPIESVVTLIVNLKENYKIIFLSGRDSKYRQVTKDWLIKNIMPCENFELIMRVENDNRKDSIIKKELYKTYIEPKYNVIGWIDDRIQVLDMIQKELGIFTFDVRQDCRGLNDF